MVERYARNKGQTLSIKFWERPEWKRNYFMQLRFANSLLKLYSFAAITKALRTPEGRKIYSLSARWLDPLIQREEAILKLQKENVTAPEESKQQQTEWKEQSGECFQCYCARNGHQHTNGPCHCTKEFKDRRKPRDGFINKSSALNKLRELDG